MSQSQENSQELPSYEVPGDTINTLSFSSVGDSSFQDQGLDLPSELSDDAFSKGIDRKEQVVSFTYLVTNLPVTFIQSPYCSS